MCDKAGIMLGWDHANKRCLAARANCDTWQCGECAARMSERWGLRASMGAREIMSRGESVDFVTITSHEKLKTFEACEGVWKSAWNALYCAIKRRKSDLSYLIVPEEHKDGRMHVHALWNAGVTQKWLKDNARKRGFGYQCKIVPIHSAGYAAKYVVKYVGKNIGVDRPAHFRRVRVSRDWADIPQPTTADTNLQWEYVGTNGALQVVYAECQSKSYTMIDKATGAYWDDVDLDLLAVGD